MLSLADIVVYSTVGAVLAVVFVTGSCGVYIALSRTQAQVQKLTCNKYVLPGFPSHGTLMMMARDGVVYVVPEGKAVIKCTGVVHEVHGGRISRGCDRNGRFVYDDGYDYDDPSGAQEAAEHNQNALDHVFSNWPFADSPRSQDMTVSITSEEESVLAGEIVTNEGMPT
ncbi:unnamed protein product [Ectocarpus sp. 12 AP-2014]